MIGVDIIEVKIGCGWVGLARPWQDMRHNPRTASEGDDRAAAITAECIGCRHDAAQRRGDRGTIQFRQHRIGGCAPAIA